MFSLLKFQGAVTWGRAASSYSFSSNSLQRRLWLVSFRSSNSSSSHARRSSIVVIPPMQICPGDLLVYSKVLTHRNNLLGKCNCERDGILLPRVMLASFVVTREQWLMQKFVFMRDQESISLRMFLEQFLLPRVISGQKQLSRYVTSLVCNLTE
jgi:hypothetical protein